MVLKLLAVVRAKLMVLPFKYKECVALAVGVVKPLPTNTLALAVAVTPVLAELLLMAAALAMALDALVTDVVEAKVAVSSVLSAPAMLRPLMRKRRDRP